MRDEKTLQPRLMAPIIAHTMRATLFAKATAWA